MRIVSLLPAATEIVCALGLRDNLVGRSHGCDFPPGVEALPVLTSARVDSSLSSAELDAQVRETIEGRLPIYTLDERMLAALAPDVVVTQGTCDVCAVSHEQVVAALPPSAGARIVSLSPARLDDIFQDVRTVADACGISDRGAVVSDRLVRRAHAAAAVTAGRPRVAVVEWLAPMMLAGHWVPDAIKAAGGVAVGPKPGEPSAYATWEEVAALEPDAVVVAPCGFDLERTGREAAPFATELRSLASRVLLLDGNALLNRPGPRIVDAIEVVGGWLAGSFVRKEQGAGLIRDLGR